MKQSDGRVVVGIIFILAGIFLVINQYVLSIPFFPWILLVIGVAIFLISIFSANVFGGLQALIWLGGLAFAFYYNQVLPGILIIIGVSVIMNSLRSMFYKTNKVKIEIDEEKNKDQ
jgi:predicted membrane protein